MFAVAYPSSRNAPLVAPYQVTADEVLQALAEYPVVAKLAHRQTDRVAPCFVRNAGDVFRDVVCFPLVTGGALACLTAIGVALTITVDPAAAAEIRDTGLISAGATAAMIAGLTAAFDTAANIRARIHRGRSIGPHAFDELERHAAEASPLQRRVIAEVARNTRDTIVDRKLRDSGGGAQLNTLASDDLKLDTTLRAFCNLFFQESGTPRKFLSERDADRLATLLDAFEPAEATKLRAALRHKMPGANAFSLWTFTDAASKRQWQAALA